MRKNTSLFLITLLIIQNFILSCSLPINSSIIKNNVSNTSFKQKSTPDVNICGKPDFVGISVSKNTVATKNDSIIITTNIPQKVQDFVSLGYPSDKYDKKFIVRAESYTKNDIFELDVQPNCTSFDWDLKDKNGKQLDIRKYDLKMYFKVNKISEPQNVSYLEFNQLFSYFTNLAFLCNDVVTFFLAETNPFVYTSNFDMNNSIDIQRRKNCQNIKPVFSYDDKTKAITSTSFNVADPEEPPLDPATTKFFEVEDFKKLSDYANALQIDDNSANALYDQSKILDSFLARKQSLIDRGSTDTAKMAEIDASIADINTSIVSLQGSVLGQLSELYNQANVLANHVNTITEQQYITPYPIDEKPIGVGDYSDKGFFSSQGVETYLDPFSFYEPDKNNVNQTQLSTNWDIEHSRQEALEPENIFKTSKYLFEEIQTAKDLSSDITSGAIPLVDTKQASETLKNIVSNIKSHIKLSQAKNKDFYNQYIKLVDKITDLHKYTKSELLLNFGTIIDTINDYDDGTFRLKSINPDDIKIEFGKDLNKLDNFKEKYTNFEENLKKLRSKLDNKSFKVESTEDVFKYFENRFKYFQSDINTYKNIITSFDTSNIPKKEKVLAILLSIDKNQWDNLKANDPTLITDLIKSFDEVLDFLINQIKDKIEGSTLGLLNVDKIIQQLEAYYRQQASPTNKNKKVQGNVPQTPQSTISGKILKVVKVGGIIFQIWDAGKFLIAIDDLYNKAVPVRQAASKYCYSFAQTVPSDPNYKGKKCVNELGAIVIAQNNNKTLKEHYNKNNKIYPKNKILGSLYVALLLAKNDFEVIKALNLYNAIPPKASDTDTDKIWKDKIYNESIQIFKNISSQGGVPIAKISLQTQPNITEIYTPNFEKVLTNDSNGNKKFVVDIQGMDGTQGVSEHDFITASNNLINHLDLRNSVGLISEKTLRSYIKDYFVWHHHEGLVKMILLPKKAHNLTLKHWGAAHILRNTANNQVLRDKWKNSLTY